MSSHAPSSHLSFHVLKKNQPNNKKKEAIILIMTVSISFIYTGVNFNTRPATSHENYGRQSIYKQFLPALPCSPFPPHLGTVTMDPQHEEGLQVRRGQPRIDLRLLQMCPCPLRAGNPFLTALG